MCVFYNNIDVGFPHILFGGDNMNKNTEKNSNKTKSEKNMNNRTEFAQEYSIDADKTSKNSGKQMQHKNDKSSCR